MALNAVWALICMYIVPIAAESLRCPPWATPNECIEVGFTSDEYFFTVHGKNLRLLYDVENFYITCTNDVPLESKALPRFERTVDVPNVKLTDCAPPLAGYAAALRALNVTVSRSLYLQKVPAEPQLRAEHLRDVNVGALVVNAADELLAPLRPDPAFFGPLRALRDLRLTGVKLLPSALPLLPNTLRSLVLNEVGLSTLPASAFEHLPLLTRLIVRDNLLQKADLGKAPALLTVQLTGPLAGVTLGPTVTNVTLSNARSATLFGNCSSLRNIVVGNVTEALPAGWLEACPAVTTVALWSMRLGSVGEDFLRGASSLRELQVLRCGLTELPPRWLMDTPALRRLDLSINALKLVPSELVNAAPALEDVVLVKNQLKREALVTLAALPALRDLSLDHNTLTNLCGSGDDYIAYVPSPLSKARGLRSLSLERTGLSRICPDWRTDLVELRTLNLRYNNISSLEYEDLQWRRKEPTEVDLRDNPVRDVHYTKDRFIAVLADNSSEAIESSGLTTILLNGKLKCDCVTYWYARAALERPSHARARLRSARCAAAPLSAVAPRELLCALPACPPACACRVSGARSELRCAGAGLRALPAAPAALPARALLLAHNNISRLAPDDITPELEILDLSYNNISTLDAATVARLFDAPRSVLLAGNPLRCDCAALPLLGALAGRRGGAGGGAGGGAAGVHCAGGEHALAAEARLRASCVAPLWPLALAALALAAACAAAAACLVRPATRQRIKVFLFERGLCLRWVLRPPVEGEDAERPYDAFVSYSHRDAQFAAELALRLERGAGLRLCLHERDWRAGEWIPAQIARSVRRSRRTLVLLSEHFLASDWGRAELREAYAAALREQRPRLLLLLLPGLAPARAAAADRDLRAYLARVTYLRWDEPRFWHKLLLAMPRPAPPAPPEPAAAAA